MLNPSATNEGTPSVSVLMTVYNGEKHLETAVRSILEQTLADWELIVVDDGSSDATEEILARLSQDERVRIIASSHIGRVAALNLAWREARAPYLAILDADDVALPNRLALQLDFLRSHPRVGLLGSACEVVDDTSGRKWIRRHAADEPSLRAALVRENSFIHSAVMMPRAVLAEVGGYDSRYQKCHDYELYVRIGQRYALANLEQVLIVKRVHRDASFRFGFSRWRSYRERMSARWRAWRSFSRSVYDLPYVAEPMWRYFKSTAKSLLPL